MTTAASPSHSSRHTGQSARAAVAFACAPVLLIVTADPTLAARLTEAAEASGWATAVVLPSSAAAATGPWDAVAVDADCGLGALWTAHAAHAAPVIGVAGWWDARVPELQGLCDALLHRPVRAAEVAEVLGALERLAVPEPQRLAGA